MAKKEMTRRKFLKMLGGATAGLFASRYMPKLIFANNKLEPIETELNPLETYPNRDWEEVYRDIYSTDFSYMFLCAPNDTHGCLLDAKVKNGVVKYTDPSFGYGKATDIYDNSASPRWDPRICPNGHTYIRRSYSDRRVKGALVRSGFKSWVEAGRPRRADGLPERKYFENRGKDTWEQITFDEGYSLVAGTLKDVAETYTGKAGADLLARQGYHESMIEKTKTAEGEYAGIRTLKFRASMAWLSALRFTGLYRFANSLALLDASVRNLDDKEAPEKATGPRSWDSYSWHTDLPPGHPMVTGNKTSDFDLFATEYSDLITLWGMNWIATKMVEGHWLTEARTRGAEVITIATEYQSTSNKADHAIVIRPATDTVFALSVAQYLMSNPSRYDRDYVIKFTDLPLLVRMDTLEMLRMEDIEEDYSPSELSNYTQVGGSVPSFLQQDREYLTDELRNEWNDFVLWDTESDSPSPVTRDEVGEKFENYAKGDIEPALDMGGTPKEVTLADGTTRVKVRTVFDLIKEYADNNFTPDQASDICWAPVSAIETFAEAISANQGKTLFAVGMGPNHYWTNDLKDRAIFLIACLTANEGKMGGEVGSYAGNYRLELFNGIGQWAAEDPFDIQTDPKNLAKVKKYKGTESAHYYNYGDRPLEVGNNMFTGDSHMPTPTKTVWWVDANSILGNCKWAYDVIVNTLPRMEMIVTNEWFWTKTCEYSDVVFGVPSWIERKIPDLYGSCTNPFLQMVVPSEIDYIHDVRDDLETYMGVAEKLAEITGDDRFNQLWKFRTSEGLLDMSVYGQRVMDTSNALKGYEWNEVLKSCKKGIPKYMMARTTPRIGGWEQINESKPWYTKTGRMEFYREEKEWRHAGENLPVFRETVDSTHYEPAVILGRTELDGSPSHPAIRPRGPEDYGFAKDALDAETRQVRNIVKPWSDLKKTKHPLTHRDPEFKFILYTPKYRHACHSMAASQDYNAVYFGPFGDFYRRDKRKPYVGEGYVDMNPDDAKELGIEDGDYIWVDGDPDDRPFRNWKNNAEDYKVMRWKVRARYYPAMPRGTARAWFHMYGATHGSVEGHETRKDGLAKNPRTGYQAAYRYGSHQSITRAWLKPTLMTDSLVRKNGMGQTIGKGHHIEIHCATGAPKESFVKITKAEDGRIGGFGRWEPADEGYRPTYENSKMSKYLKGRYGGD